MLKKHNFIKVIFREKKNTTQFFNQISIIMTSSNSISQFVSNVISFTSQYSDTQWRATNIIGPPTSNSIYGNYTYYLFN
jgi:hypothetical protein